MTALLHSRPKIEAAGEKGMKIDGMFGKDSVTKRLGSYLTLYKTIIYGQLWVEGRYPARIGDFFALNVCYWSEGDLVVKGFLFLNQTKSLGFPFTPQ